MRLSPRLSDRVGQKGRCESIAPDRSRTLIDVADPAASVSALTTFVVGTGQSGILDG